MRKSKELDNNILENKYLNYHFIYVTRQMKLLISNQE